MQKATEQLRACDSDRHNFSTNPAGGFSVAFDPLDGSSIVDTNFTVGTIFGVWPGDKLTGVTGGDQVAAAMGIYGPRTTYVIALKDCPGTHEFLLLDEGDPEFAISGDFQSCSV